MLATVFLVIVVTLLTGHYFLVERPRRLAAESANRPQALPLRQLVNRVPAGVFLQPTFTWGQVRSGGDVEIGVHPMLLSLLGPNLQMETRSAGEHVDKGDPLMTVGDGERHLVVRSPVAGSISMANAAPPVETEWQSQSDRTCVIQPESLSDEVPTWMLGQSAVDWSREQYGRIRDHLLARSADPQTGLALADGGELPVGALNQLDATEWADFEEEFLNA
jgi:hypothetical protein